MDGSTSSLLRILAAKVVQGHGFNRASSAALDTLCDLTSRYLELIASACKEEAEHAGRDTPNVYDACAALEEVGLHTDDLIDWCGREGLVLAKYRPPISPVLEDLSANLSEGARKDHTDAVLLTYQRQPSPPLRLEESVDEDYDEQDSDVAVSFAKPLALPTSSSSPIFPLSPISNPAPSPSSPRSRKRQRLMEWKSPPPDHIPEFLPPFPGYERPQSPNEFIEVDEPSSSRVTETMAPPDEHPQRIPPPPPLNPTHSSPSLCTASYLTEIPYHASTLANLPAAHLPLPPTRVQAKLSPSAHGLLLIAMETDQTQNGPANPGRLNVSGRMSFAAAARYTTSDTLYSSTNPPPPRHLAPTPVHAIAKDPNVSASSAVFPDPVSNRPLIPSYHPLNPAPSYLHPNIQLIAAHTTRPGVLERSMRTLPPEPFRDGNGSVRVHGRPIPAPWNAPPGSGTAPGEKPRAMADALLYTTWDYNVKRYDEPLKRKAASSGSGDGLVNGASAPNGVSETGDARMRTSTSGVSQSSEVERKDKALTNGSFVHLPAATVAQSS